MSFKEEIRNVKGIGKSTAESILDEFSSWDKINESELEEVTKIKGVGEKTAKSIIKKAREYAEEVEEESKEFTSRILNYKGGASSQKNNQVILEVEASQPSQLIGQRVKFKTSSGKIIKGNIISTHGNKNKLLARFERSLPGQALGTEVVIR
ncbi:hypothetical protein C9439_04770 [archaeon SCG-AAA382B04]|nr:hypothetical protein C9439_04770 [archaeon SCG-AAA382B04]